MTALSFVAGQDRDDYVVMMRRAGHTLQEIGDTLGVSRERVRQLAKRNGSVRVSLAAPGVDPIAMLRFARSRDCRSFNDCARRFGIDSTAVGRAFREIGVHDALKRLYRWRKFSRLRAVIVSQLRAFVAEHGRPPASRELNAITSAGTLPHIADVQRAFGSYKAGFRAAGIAARPIGTPGHLRRRAKGTHCRRGHELTPDNVWGGTRPDGGTWRQCKTCKRALKRAVVTA